MLLSNILITDPATGPIRTLPEIVAQNVASLRAFHPDFDYRLFDEADILALIGSDFPPRVLDAYHALKPFAYRADLARYCIMHRFGGLYADLAYFFVRPVPKPANDLVVFRGNLVSAPWDTSNGIIHAARPGLAVFECAIDLVCANVERRYYGSTALCPTGPVIFGKALAMTCEAEDLKSGNAGLLLREKVGRMVPALPLPPGDRIHCQFLDEKLVAVRRKSVHAAGLSELGLETGNDYRALWHARDVYA